MEKTERRAMWERRLEAQACSGIGVRAWCQHEGIGEANFYYWRHRLVNAIAPTQLIALPMESASSATAIEIATPSGYVVRLYSAAQCDFLPALLAALR